MDLVTRDWHLFSIRGEHFLFNSLGSLYQLDEEARSAMDTLYRGGSLDISEDVYGEIEEILSSYKPLEIYEPEDLRLKSLCLNVSHSCNMSCSYCFATHNLSYRMSLMPLEIACRAIDFLIDSSKDIKNIEIDFFGGEPLRNLKVVKNATIYGKTRALNSGKNLRFTLTTNGLLLDSKTLDLLDELEISIVLSLDGGEDTHNKFRRLLNGGGSFKTILPNAKELAERRQDGGYYIRGTYTAETLNFSDSFKKFVDFGFRYISLEPVVTNDPKLSIREEHLPVLRAEYQKIAEECLSRDVKFFHFELPMEEGACLPRLARGCGAGVEYMAVTPSGELYPCHQFVGYEGFKLGDLYTGHIDESLRKQFLRLNSIDSKEACNNCWVRYLCGGGCLANNYIMSKNITEPYSTGCEIQKMRIEYALWLRAKKSLEVKV